MSDSPLANHLSDSFESSDERNNDEYLDVEETAKEILKELTPKLSKTVITEGKRIDVDESEYDVTPKHSKSGKQ